MKSVCMLRPEMLVEEEEKGSRCFFIFYRIGNFEYTNCHLAKHSEVGCLRLCCLIALNIPNEQEVMGGVEPIDESPCFSIVFPFW
jgi:hypothetical protein